MIFDRFLLRAAPLGSIKDLAAESCSEIMASEGDEMAKNEHWIYSDGNGGQAILAKCEGTAFFKSLPTLNLDCFDPFSQGVQCLGSLPLVPIIFKPKMHKKTACRKLTWLCTRDKLPIFRYTQQVILQKQLQLPVNVKL